LVKSDKVIFLLAFFGSLLICLLFCVTRLLLFDKVRLEELAEGPDLKAIHERSISLAELAIVEMPRRLLQDAFFKDFRVQFLQIRSILVAESLLCLRSFLQRFWDGACLPEVRVQTSSTRLEATIELVVV